MEGWLGVLCSTFLSRGRQTTTARNEGPRGSPDTRLAGSIGGREGESDRPPEISIDHAAGLINLAAAGVRLPCLPDRIIYHRCSLCGHCERART